MKKIILTTLFSFLISNINALDSSESLKKEIELLRKSLHNLKGESFKLKKGKKFIVLKNNRNCMMCFKEISELSARLADTVKDIEYLTVSSVKEGMFERKVTNEENKKIFTNYTHLFFYTQNTFEGPMPSVYYTPELLLLNNKNSLRLNYRDLFNKEGNCKEDSVLKVLISFFRE